MSEQFELPGMPEDGPLGIVAKRFVAIKERIAEAKLEQAQAEKDILTQMRTDSVPHFKISVAGENYEFELVPGEDGLRRAKITKNAKKPEPMKEAEPAPAAA